MDKITLNEMISQNPILLNESFFSMLKFKYIFGVFPQPVLKDDYLYITINNVEYIIESYDCDNGIIYLLDEYNDIHTEKIYNLPYIEEDMLELKQTRFLDTVYIKEDCIIYNDNVYDILSFVKNVFNNLYYSDKIKIINSLNSIDLDNMKINFSGKVISFKEYINEIKKINTRYYNIELKDKENLSYKYGKHLIPISSFYNKKINNEINKDIPIPLIEEKIEII